jgi:hypothetical protein
MRISIRRATHAVYKHKDPGTNTRGPATSPVGRFLSESRSRQPQPFAERATAGRIPHDSQRGSIRCG